MASKWFQLRDLDTSPFSALVLSAGVGNARFRPLESIADEQQGVGFFGSAALRVFAPISVIADWSGQDLVLATSLAPLTQHGFVFSLGLADVTDQTGDGARLVAQWRLFVPVLSRARRSHLEQGGADPTAAPQRGRPFSRLRRPS